MPSRYYFFVISLGHESFHDQGTYEQIHLTRSIFISQSTNWLSNASCGLSTLIQYLWISTQTIKRLNNMFWTWKNYPTVPETGSTGTAIFAQKRRNFMKPIPLQRGGLHDSSKLICKEIGQELVKLYLHLGVGHPLIHRS